MSLDYFAEKYNISERIIERSPLSEQYHLATKFIGSLKELCLTNIMSFD